MGKWFHSTENDGLTIRWQGYVWQHVGGPEDLYLLALYEWFIGQEDRQGRIFECPRGPLPRNVKSANVETGGMLPLISSANMGGWRFYDFQEEMHAYYREYCARRENAERRRKQRMAIISWLLPRTWQDGSSTSSPPR